MAEVDAKLLAALKQARTSPMFFAFVANGNEGKLLVEKKKINPKEAAEIKKECGGGTIYKGRCKGEEGKMVFEVGKEVPATLAALTKKIIKNDAAMVCEVEYRVAADLAAEESVEEHMGESAAGAPPAPPVPTAAPPAHDLEWKKAHDAIQPGYLKVLRDHPDK